MARRYGLKFDPDQEITVTCGITEALSVIFMSLLDPGDEVLLIEPFHEGFQPQVKFAGGTPVFVALEEPDYLLDAERVRAAITPRTKAILINTPHNPTGRVFTREELAGVAKVCQEFDLVAITDEIYERIIYDGRQHIPIATLPGMAERTITVGGFGKTYAVTGWRLGYVCAPEPFIGAIRTVHDFTTICAPVPLQAACVAALEMPESYYEQLTRDYTARRALIMPALAALNFKTHTPRGIVLRHGGFQRMGLRWGRRGLCPLAARARWSGRGSRLLFLRHTRPGDENRAVRLYKKLETLEAAVAACAPTGDRVRWNECLSMACLWIDVGAIRPCGKNKSAVPRGRPDGAPARVCGPSAAYISILTGQVFQISEQ